MSRLHSHGRDLQQLVRRHYSAGKKAPKAPVKGTNKAKSNVQPATPATPASSATPATPAKAATKSRATDPESVSARFGLYAFGGVVAFVLIGGYGAWEAARRENILHGPIPKHRNDGPPGKFESAAREVRVAKKPSKDKEWSSYMPDWSPIKDRVTDVLLPEWANSLPGFLDKLQSELTAEPGTLAEEMWKEAQDPSIHPEILLEAQVRVGDSLCPEELQFIHRRKQQTRKALASYLGLKEDDVHPDDVPTIAMCGSGGGLRAMVAGASSYYSAQKAGLLDCVTYTAGVSGSCWLQALYFSTITGQKLDRLLQHLKDRLGVHIAYPPEFLRLTTSAPTNKFLMSGGYEKYRGYENADFGLVDAYGLMLGARLLIPKGDRAINDSNLKLSNQKRYIDDGQHPMPIYTAVRHEIPAEETVQHAEEEVKATAKKEAWFQWFEFSPYEFACEELQAGIPTWSVGREFENGRSKKTDAGLALPEIRVPLLLGIYASAFCATLSHYYKEIKPLLMGLTGFGSLDEMVEGRNEDLVKMHPIDPATIPNYAIGMKDRLPSSCPQSIHDSKKIQLMDAGMSNNLPIYPLLRPGRDVDIIIAFDASAELKKDNWLKVTDGYARQRGITGWPIGTGWPEDKDDGPEQTGKAMAEADEGTQQKAVSKLNQAADDQTHATAARDIQEDAYPEKKPKRPPPTELGFCNIWVGSIEERISEGEPPPTKQVEDGKDLMEPNAGIAVIYFPFMANPKVEGVDPLKSEYMSTWNFIYRPDQIDKVVELAKTNFDEGQERVKMCIKAVYERKKQQRLEREEREQRTTRWWQLVGQN